METERDERRKEHKLKITRLWRKSKTFHEQEKLLHDFIHTAQFAFEGTGCQNKTGSPSYEYSPSPSTGVNNDCSPIKLYSKVVENDTLLTVDLPPEKDNRNMLNPMSASTQPDPKSLANIAIKIREIERSKDELKKSKTDTLITKKFGRKNNSDKRVSENLTVRNIRRPKFFTSEIFPELFHRENENNIYFALTIWRFFTTKSIFFFIIFFFLFDEIWT